MSGLSFPPPDESNGTNMAGNRDWNGKFIGWVKTWSRDTFAMKPG